MLGLQSVCERERHRHTHTFTTFASNSFIFGFRLFFCSRRNTRISDDNILPYFSSLLYFIPVLGFSRSNCERYLAGHDGDSMDLECHFQCYHNCPYMILYPWLWWKQAFHHQYMLYKIQKQCIYTFAPFLRKLHIFGTPQRLCCSKNYF